jgi:DNA repair exonuclease SbcCD ATPase subunit
MIVSLEFYVGDQEYKIERGRKPNILKFYVNNKVTEAEDNAQGDSRETQDAIEDILGMSHDMFKHIMALNTYTEPFLSLKANDQRTIIEQLLGITMLSERADRIKELSRITKEDITREEFRIRAVQDANKRIQEQIDSLKRRQTLWVTKNSDEIKSLETALTALQEIDIEAEISAHKAFVAWEALRKNLNDHSTAISRAKMDLAREDKMVKKITAEIISLENHTCHTCGQAFHDSKHKSVLAEKKTELSSAIEASKQHFALVSDLQASIDKLGKIGKKPVTFYEREEDAIQHRANVANLQKDIESKKNEIDPYAEQITEMLTQAVEEVSYDSLNELTRLQEHQDFLLKLLTSKDSFIRKKIIEQNLSYLNTRLTHYLDRIGLPHTVVFQNDLTVSIEELGRELDFDNLSRGERNRLILSMAWAFRDVFESLYQPINVLFIDEMIDNGLDTQGVESALALLKQMSRERHKSIWLVSHRDELAGRVENILKVVKENGYTSYNTDTETA